MSNRDLEITCRNCGQVIHHECNASLVEAAKHLYRLKPDDPPPKEIFNGSNPYYFQGDEKSPIFTESFLYPLLGKETARSILRAVASLIEVTGLDPRMIAEEAHNETLNDRFSRSNKKLANALRFEKERSGVAVHVRLPENIVAALDAAVADTTATTDWSSRSAVVESLIGARFLKGGK